MAFPTRRFPRECSHCCLIPGPSLSELQQAWVREAFERKGLVVSVFALLLSAHLWPLLHRPMSLSTIAILNSVKKAVESNSRHRTRSTGALPFALNPGSADGTRSHGESEGQQDCWWSASDTPRVQSKSQSKPPPHPFKWLLFSYL